MFPDDIIKIAIKESNIMLIECSECGKQISSKATVCPNCGCPIEYNVTNKTNTQKNMCICVMVVIIHLRALMNIWDFHIFVPIAGEK